MRTSSGCTEERPGGIRDPAVASKLLETLFRTNDKTSWKGRSVMVPLSKVGFCKGELKPTVHQGEEQVRIVSEEQKNEPSHQMVSTPQLQEWLQQQAATGAQNSPQATAKTSSKTKQKPKGLPPFSAASDKSRPSTVPRSSDSQPKQHGSSSVLPMVEIQEEYSATGDTPLRGNVIDISQQMKKFYESMSGETKGDDEQAPAGWTGEAEEESEQLVVPDNGPSPISDQDYDQLSQRLEELARLEEKQEKEVAQTKKRTKKKSTWNKGFLNTPVRSPGKKKSADAEKKTKPAAKQVPTATPVASAGVSFDDSKTTIREIPSRSGVSPSPAAGSATSKAPPSLQPTTTTTSFMVDMIQERIHPSSSKSQTTGPESFSSSKQKAVPTPPTTTAEPPTKKRQSRFAQERQQGRR